MKDYSRTPNLTAEKISNMSAEDKYDAVKAHQAWMKRMRRKDKQDLETQRQKMRYWKDSEYREKVKARVRTYTKKKREQNEVRRNDELDGKHTEERWTSI